jgi:hypothetical protein
VPLTPATQVDVGSSHQLGLASSLRNKRGGECFGNRMQFFSAVLALFSVDELFDVKVDCHFFSLAPTTPGLGADVTPRNAGPASSLSLSFKYRERLMNHGRAVWVFFSLQGCILHLACRGALWLELARLFDLSYLIYLILCRQNAGRADVAGLKWICRERDVPNCFVFCLFSFRKVKARKHPAVLFFGICLLSDNAEISTC